MALLKTDLDKMAPHERDVLFSKWHFCNVDHYEAEVVAAADEWLARTGRPVEELAVAMIKRDADFVVQAGAVVGDDFPDWAIVALGRLELRDRIKRFANASAYGVIMEELSRAPRPGEFWIPVFTMDGASIVQTSRVNRPPELVLS